MICHLKYVYKKIPSFFQQDKINTWFRVEYYWFRFIFISYYKIHIYILEGKKRLRINTHAIKSGCLILRRQIV